mgnify:CR=1 FL=1
MSTLDDDFDILEATPVHEEVQETLQETSADEEHITGPADIQYTPPKKSNPLVKFGVILLGVLLVVMAFALVALKFLSPKSKPEKVSDEVHHAETHPSMPSPSVQSSHSSSAEPIPNMGKSSQNSLLSLAPPSETPSGANATPAMPSVAGVAASSANTSAQQISPMESAPTVSNASAALNSIASGVSPVTSESSSVSGQTGSSGIMSLSSAPSAASASNELATSATNSATASDHSSEVGALEKRVDKLSHEQKSIMSTLGSIQKEIQHIQAEPSGKTVVVYRNIYRDVPVETKPVIRTPHWTIKAIVGDKAVVHVQGAGDITVVPGSIIHGIKVISVNSKEVKTSHGNIYK